MNRLKVCLLFGVSFLLGCSSSNNESSSASSLQLNTVIQAPGQAQEGDVVHAEIEAFTNGVLPSVSASGNSLLGEACSAIKITGIMDETTADNVELKFIVPGYDAEVGSGKACWNGMEGASLECGESCTQIIRYTTKDTSQAGSIHGRITFETLSVNAKGSESVDINTDFLSNSQLKALPLEIVPTFKLRPNAQVTLQINNTSNETLNTVYVDFSQLNSLLPGGIDYENVGSGYYDATLQRWMVPGVLPGKSITLVYSLKDAISAELNKAEVQSLLTNNSATNPMLLVGAVDYPTVYPLIDVNKLPYDYVRSKKKFALSETGLQDSIQISLPSNAISPLTFDSMDRTNLPLGVSVVSSLPEGSALNPGETMIITTTANTNAETTSGCLGIKFVGNSQTYSDTFNINVNAMTTVSNQQNNLSLVGSPDPQHSISTITLTLYNSGKFDAQLPVDLSMAFNLNGLTIVSSQSNTCQATNLTPGQSCHFTIAASSGGNRIATITTIGDSKNILPNITLAKIQVLESTSDLAVVIPVKNIPNKIKAGETVDYEVSITPILDDLTIENITYPAGVNSSQCQWIGNNLPIDNVIKNGVKYLYQCHISPEIGALIAGNITFNVKQGETGTNIGTPFIQTEGVKADQLPANGINLSSNVVFSLGSNISFTVENDTNTLMTGLKIDLSGLTPQLRHALVLSSLTQQDSTISYDSQTGMVTIDDILLPQDTKSVVFYLDTSPDNLAALKANEDKINNNFSQKQAVKLMSQTAQDFYPALVANSHIVEGILENILSLNSDNQTNFTLNNNTSEDLDIVINFTDQDLQKALQQQIISMREKGILANGSAAITLRLPANSTLLPGVYAGNLILTEAGDKQIYTYEIKLFIPNSPITVVSNNIVADIPAKGSSETPVVLRNNGTRDIFGVSLSDSFVVTDQSGNIIDSSLISFSDPIQGGSIISSIKPNQQATLGIVLHASDSWVPNTVYTVSSKAIGLSNLEAQFLLFSFKMDDISPELNITTNESLPDTVLADQTMTYQAVIINSSTVDAYTYKVLKVITPDDKAVFDSTWSVGANQYLYNGQTGATLKPGESATLKFDITLTKDETFSGDILIEVEAFDQEGKSLGTRDLKVVSADVSTQADVQIATLNSTDIQLRPAVAVKFVLDHTQDLNNAYLDLSDMPSEVYDQLIQIQLIAQNKSMNFSQMDIQQYKNTQIVPLGYVISPSTGTQIYLNFSLTSGAVLNSYKTTLEDSNIPPIQIGAANSKKIAPAVTVYDTVIDKQQIQVGVPSIKTITFTNNSDYPINITRLITDNLPLGVILQSAGTCTPDSVISITGNCEAQIEIQQNAQGNGELLLEYRIEEQAQDTQLSQSHALSENMVTFTATADISAEPVGAKLEIANSLQIPLPQTPEGSVNKYLVNISNLGKLDLNAIDGMTIGQGVQLLDKEGNPYTNAYVLLVSDDSLITRNCMGQSLLANSSCQMVIEVGKEALPIDGLNLRFKIDRFKNLDLNLIDVSAANFNVVNQAGHLSFLNDNNELITHFEKSTTPASNFQFRILNDGGSAVTFTQLPSYSASNLDITTSCSLGEALIPQQQCKVLVSPQNTTQGTLSFAYNNGQMVTSNIELGFTINPYKKILSGPTNGIGATCALTRNGELYCFGNNYQKQIFSSPSGYILTPVKLDFTGTLLEGKNIIDFIAGASLCAMTDEANNNIYCWGSTRSAPEAMPIHAKKFSTFGKTFCTLTNDNDILCWGENADGQAGDTALSIGWDITTPTKIAVPNDIKFYDISVGYSASCGITLDQKNIYCWGQNDSAELGNGNASFKNGGYKPRLVDLGNVNLNDDKITLLKSSRYTDQICILTEKGAIYCWGDGFFGSLGNDEISSRYSKPITVSKKGNLNNLVWIDLAAANARGFCALNQQNTVYCWGQNGSEGNQLINPYSTADKIFIPTPLLAQGTAPYDNQGKLSLGMNAGTPCLLTDMGNAYCWSSRMVGDGTYVQNSYTAPVTRVLLP